MKHLDWLAEQACNILEKNINKLYADEKRERLKNENRFKVIVWLNSFDEKNLRELACHLGVSFEELDITRKTARSL